MGVTGCAFGKRVSRWLVSGLGASAAVLALALFAPIVQAQSRTPLRLVVPTPAGGPLDVAARALSRPLARLLGETVIVDNRPGAGGIIGTDHVAKSASDGRTLLVGSTFVPLNTVLAKAPYDMRDLVPIIELTRAYWVLMVRQGLEVRDPAQLVQAARRPAGLTCAATPGDGQMACEQFKQLLGGKVVTVPYPGMAPATNAVLGGQVDFMVATFDSATTMTDSGRAVPIATTGTKPGAAPFDRLPLARDTWPEFTLEGFIGVFAPAGLPADAVQQLHRQFSQALDDPAVQEFMLKRGNAMDVAQNPPEVFATRLRERLARYRQQAAALGLKPE